MTEGRFGHTATLLPDGTVLVTGGCACSDPSPALASAEVYDPTTGRWTPTGSMHVGRIFHRAALLADGTVLVFNDGTGTEVPSSAELFDPRSGSWARTASPAELRFGQAVTRLLDGRVLVTGDYSENNGTSAELYDPNGGR